MTDGCIQQVQLVLHAKLAEFCTGRGIHLRSGAAVCHIDLIYIFHKINGSLFSDIFVKRAAEIIGNIIFTIGKRPWRLQIRS